MHATCPTDPSHTTFITTAHVVEEWVVDGAGNFMETMPADGGALEVSHGPDPGNAWTCTACGALATVTP